MNKITIEIPFRASHRLVAPYVGRCNNNHGEGFTAIVEFSTETLDENGMVLDFGTIKKQIKGWIDENWDHHFIHAKNEDQDVKDFWDKKNWWRFEMPSNPTSENMANYLFNEIKQNINKNVSKVGIVESFRDAVAWYQE